MNIIEILKIENGIKYIGPFLNQNMIFTKHFSYSMNIKILDFIA